MDGLWRFDQEAIRSIHLGLNHPVLDAIFFVISSTGLGWVQILLILVFTVRWGRLANRANPSAPEPIRAHPGQSSAFPSDPSHPEPTRAKPSQSPWTWPLLVAYGATGLVNAVMKKAVPRERPSNLEWANPQETFFFNSFSSGHTATAFGIATTLWWLSRGTPYAWVGRIGWIWAALVGFSRIYRGVHWPTDVVSGAAVGVVMGTVVALWWQRRVARAEQKGE